MRVWRLVKKTYIDHVWDGEGAKLYGGRWNLVGTPAVYTASTLSLAVLEILVGFTEHGVTNDFVAFALDVRHGVKIKEIQLKNLPHHWQNYPAPFDIQTIGDGLLRTKEPCIISVPSTVVPVERNYIFIANFFEKICQSVSKPVDFPLDPRLFSI